MKGEYVFTQICRFLPREEFKWIIKRYKGNKNVKAFKCWNQLLALIFGQLAGCESLRVLVSSLMAHKSKLYHLGIGTSLSVSNFAYANQNRDPKIFEDLATLMIKIAREKRIEAVEDFFIAEGNVYAFDSSTISLCLSRFDWTRLHHDMGGIKIHLLAECIYKCSFHLKSQFLRHTVSDYNMFDVKPCDIISRILSRLGSLHSQLFSTLFK